MPINLHLSKSYILGLIFILAVAIIWSGASVFIQYIFKDLNFRSPFLVTYVCNSLFILYLPIYQIGAKLGWVKNINFKNSQGVDDMNKVAYEKIADEIDSPLSTHSPPRELSRNGDHASNYDSNDDLNINCHKKEQVNNSYVRNEEEPLAEYCHLDVLKIALVVSPIWFIANCFYNYSLFMTSITSSTIISNLSGSFTLAFSYFSGVEEVTIPKVLGVILCFIGAIVATLQDAESKSSFVGPSSFWGDLVALFAAIGYGVYTTVIRKKIPDDSGISMQLLLGYIGLVNFVLLLPVLIVFCVLNYGNIMAATSTILGFIILTGIIDNALSDYLWARAVVLTSPTVATIGMSITIPLALITDYVLGNGSPSYLAILGSILVIIGFLLVYLRHQTWIGLYKYCSCFNSGDNCQHNSSEPVEES